MSASYTSISPDKLSRLVSTAATPTLVDARIDQDFSADPRLIPGSVRRQALLQVERESPALGRVPPILPRRGQAVAQLADQQWQVRPKA